MSSTRLRRVLSIFREATRRPRHDRDTYLRDACNGDPALLEEVSAMLAGEHEGEDPLDDARVALGEILTRGRSQSAPLPERVGRYTPIRRIGTGAMGVVYEARQETPNRAVALKMLRRGAFDRERLLRFEQEAEILGRLRHPGIAQIFEGGAVESDDAIQPFLAMELVSGTDLVSFAEQRELGVEERLVLLARVADAVQHAHEHWVIHRDLKPDNIVVGDDGRPKILDFGVARITEPGSGHTTLTVAGELVGTIAYMSPEQLDGSTDVGPPSDVYALGVIAFELLSGQLPVSLDDRPLAEAILAARECRPARLGSIDPNLRGDCETIVAKALDRDIQRRYQSAGALADDIRRFLNNEPIHARRPTLLYQAKMSARRNRGVVVALTVLVLVAGLATWAVSSTLERARLIQAREQQLRLRSALTAASEALGRHDLASARTSLESVPALRRGWEWRYLTSQLSSWIIEHESSASAFGRPAYVAGGRFVAAAQDDGTVALWRPTGAEQVRTLEADGVQLTTLSRTQPPGRVVAGTSDGRILSWDLATGERSAFDLGARVPVNRLDTSRSGVYVASVRHERRLQTRILRPGQPPIVIPHTHHKPGVAMHPDGQRAAVLGRRGGDSWGENDTIYIFDTASGALLATVETTGDPVDLAYSPDGALLALANLQRSVKVLDAETHEVRFDLLGHTEEVTDVGFTPDAGQLVSVSRDGTFRVWDLVRGDCIATIAHGGSAHLAIDPRAPRLCAVGEAGGSVHTWWRASPGPRVLRGHTSYVYGVEYLPESGLLVSSGFFGFEGSTTRLWDACLGDPVAIMPWTATEGWMVMSPDGRRILSGGPGWGDLRTVDVLTGDTQSVEVVKATSLRELSEQRDRWMRSFAGAVGTQADLSAWGLAVSADARYVAHRIDDETLCVRRGFDGPILAKLPGVRPRGTPDFSPDGQLVAFAAKGDDAAYVWHWDRDDKPVRLAGHTSEVYCVRFHPDGTRLATGGNDNKIIIWDTITFTKLLELTGHTRYVQGLAWSPDGSQLASASGDYTVRLWEAIPPSTCYLAGQRAKRLTDAVGPVVERLHAAGGHTASILESPEVKALDPSHQQAVKRVLIGLRWRTSK